jgi:hypothetical protein
MKKFIALFIVLAVLAPVVFAQDAGITFSGWGRGVFAPIQLVDPDAEGKAGDSKVYAGVGKWNAYPRIGFSVKGNAEYAGFQADLFVLENGLNGSASVAKDAYGPGFPPEDIDIEVNETGAGIPVGDNAYVWVKPWNFLKVSVGKFKDDTLRGKISDTNFAGGVTLGMRAEDDIFTRFSGNGLGAEVALTPIEGLYIAALVNAGYFPIDSTAPKATSREAKYVYEKIQVGAGYEIANIGHARAQFVGGAGTVGDAPRVEIAFALTAVENLLVDLGGKIWFPATKELDKTTTDDLFDTKTLEKGASYSNPIGISVGAQYDLDAFSIVARFDTEIGGGYKNDDYETTRGFGLNAHLVPSYNLGFATVGADIGFQLNPATTSKPKSGETVTTNEGGIEFGLGAWIQKNVGNGLIKTGIGEQLPTEVSKPKGEKAEKSNLVLTIPVILEYSF